MLRRTISCLVITLSMSSIGHADMLANSVSDFDNIQGSNNWYYGFYDGDAPDPYSTGDFELMTQFSGGIWHVQSGMYWTELSINGGHPNGLTTTGSRVPMEQWAVRRWVSDFEGTIQVMGTLADDDHFFGNGAVGHVIVDGNLIWTAEIENGDMVGIDFDLFVPVQIGSLVDFAIDPRASHDHSDSTVFSAMLMTVPEPGSVALISVAGLGFLAVARRRKKSAKTTNEN